MRNLLVSVQVALSVVVLIGASLQVSSLWKVLQVDPGYTFESGLVIDVDLPERDYPDDAARSRFFDLAIERVEAVPGASGACAMTVPAGQPHRDHGEHQARRARRSALQHAPAHGVWPGGAFALRGGDLRAAGSDRCAAHAEIGIRMALGARGSDVVRHVVLGTTMTVLAGLLVGGLSALLATRFLEHMLFGVTPTEPLVYVSVLGIVLFVALLAAYLPARRATRIDPLEALRAE